MFYLGLCLMMSGTLIVIINLKVTSILQEVSYTSQVIAFTNLIT